MNLKDIGKAIAKTAPILGTALGGPAGAAVGALIAAVFGGDPNNPDELYKLIQNDPDAIVKLKQIEADHDIELKKILMQNYQTEVDDRKDARKNNSNNKALEVIAFVFIVGYFIFPMLSMFKIMPLDDNVSARLQDALMLILSFYFGSSRGERNAISK